MRGRGLMIGVELPTHNEAIALEQECFRRGLLVLTCGPASVRLAPPLVVTTEQCDVAVGILDDALTTIGANAAPAFAATDETTA